MLLETDLIPFHISQPVGKRVIVLSPHPDDETLGCGGTISLLAQAKKDIKIIFLTSGDKADPSHKLSNLVINETSMPQGGVSNENVIPRPSITTFEGRLNRPMARSQRLKEGIQKEMDSLLRTAGMTKMVGCSGAAHITTAYSLLREKEALKALKVLGVSDYEFLRFPDRGLSENYKDVFERVLQIYEDFLPDAVYCPSMIELNPDHRTASRLAIDLQNIMSVGNKDKSPFSILFYEITTPLRPNLLVDITSVYNKKKKAVKKYKSQLKLADYLRHITALNKVRTLTASECKYAEAFWLADRPMTDVDIVRWLSYKESINAK